jgi:8-oxo-dGTP diphosphatase
MISQVLIFNEKNEVLIVKQYVQQGDIVWNFLGGQVEKCESREEACIREVKEETGYSISIKKILLKTDNKCTFLAEVISGSLELDQTISDNADIIDNAWISLSDDEKWDNHTLFIIHHFISEK